MLTIRLSRIGKKNSAFFRVVVMDKRKSSVSGRFLEILGHIHPHTKEKSFKKDRILYWISVGAKPSDSVFNLLVRENILTGPKKTKKIRLGKKGKEEEAPKAAVEGEKTEEVKTEEPAVEEVKEEIIENKTEVTEEVAEVTETPAEEVKEEVKTEEAPVEEIAEEKTELAEETPAEEVTVEEAPIAPEKTEEPITEEKTEEVKGEKVKEEEKK